jgi:dienelactone hydrolase
MTDLGSYSDLVNFAASRGAGDLDEATVRRLIGFDTDRDPLDVRVDDRWSRDGVDGEELSWSVGYGPRTRARFLRPTGTAEPLPGVLALHGHDAYKYHGLEKIADGPNGRLPELAVLRDAMYEGRAFANELARRGFAVLVPDVFLWGSRRFDAIASGPPPPPEERWIAAENTGDPNDIPWYNRLAARHEHVVAKYCALLGTSLAGIVAYEDRVASTYLAGRPDVRPGPLGCVGLSGGGARAALLQATSTRIGASVIVGMMSTHDTLLDRHVANHTWMLFPANLRAHGDWPDLAASRAPSPLLVQYLLDDALFPRAGMEAAHRRLTERYGSSENYVGEFYPGPHRFDINMQDSAFARLEAWLRPSHIKTPR